MPSESLRPDAHDPDVRDEFERLASEGRRRIVEDRARREPAQREAAETHLRAALAARYGAPLPRAFAILAAAGGLTALCGTLGAGVALLPVGVLLLIGGLVLREVVPPLATRASVQAEVAWVDGLPFGMTGYFEALEAGPRDECRLRVTLTWADGHVPPGGEVVQNVFGVLDTSAQVRSVSAKDVTLRTGPISGATGVRVNKVSVYRNTQIVTYVHNLVTKALGPMHRKHAIARVSLSRE